MFLDTVLTRNPALVGTATALHRSGTVPPDTYVIDADAVEANAALLADEAERLGLSLWFVVKQLGRNPALIRAIARHIPRFAAIDPSEARILRANGARAGNLGHLVQIPRRDLPEMLVWRPEAVTVFDLANARAVSDAARELGFVQDVLVRIEGAADRSIPARKAVYRSTPWTTSPPPRRARGHQDRGGHRVPLCALRSGDRCSRPDRHLRTGPQGTGVARRARP